MDCKCETCVRTDCKERTKQDDLRIVISCDDYLERKTTNADRIRAMSDEELAKAIASKAYMGACNDFDITYNGKCCRNCEKCDAIIKWLKQPAEGE